MPENPNIYVSNGTCYYNQGYKADSSMIPCGNEYFAHAPCCQVNDTCLESNACYNAEYGVTYITGCTDSFYNSSVCPDKYEDLNDPTWMGMAYCNGSSNEWILCNQPDDPSTIESPAPCSCPTATSDRTMIMSAASFLTATASLPSAVGLEINYVAGHYPTSLAVITVTASNTHQSTTGGQGLTVTAVATMTAPKLSGSAASSTQVTSTSQGLGTNATIGVTVGAAVGGVLLLAALVFFLHRLLHWKQGQQNVDGKRTEGGNEKAPTEIPDDMELADGGAAQAGHTGNEQASRFVSSRTSAVSGMDDHSARPWSMGSDDAGRTSSLASPARIGSIWEQAHGGHTGPVELAANPLVELEA